MSERLSVTRNSVKGLARGPRREHARQQVCTMQRGTRTMGPEVDLPGQMGLLVVMVAFLAACGSKPAPSPPAPADAESPIAHDAGARDD